MTRPPIALTELERQHQLGWPDMHPEDYCHRCGAANISWYAPAPLWNAVMNYPDEPYHGIICMTCFTELAQASGIHTTWKLTYSPGLPPIDLPVTRADGATYDFAADRWTQP